MYPYQQQFGTQYQPEFSRTRPLAQVPPAAPAPAASPAMKAATTVVTLGVTAAATWVGIRTGLKGKGAVKVAGWVGGIGVGILGLATVVNLISPPTAKTIMVPFTLPSA